MGSACLFFELQPNKAVLTDINSDLIRTFIAVRDHPQAVSNRLAKIRLGKRSYYATRSLDLADMDDADAAARFIFLNRFFLMGYTGQMKPGNLMSPSHWLNSSTTVRQSLETLGITIKTK